MKLCPVFSWERFKSVSKASLSLYLTHEATCLLSPGYSLERYSQQSGEDVQMIRKADLENHNKDGGLWVVIHGKVYDVLKFSISAPCGADTFYEWAGEPFKGNCKVSTYSPN